MFRLEVPPVDNGLQQCIKRVQIQKSLYCIKVQGEEMVFRLQLIWLNIVTDVHFTVPHVTIRHCKTLFSNELHYII